MHWIAPLEDDPEGDVVAPSLRLVYKLHLQIQNIRWTGDLLLPPLLAGQVGLSNTIGEDHG